MKKIIYSLVIMIAAGSLFTSCIEPVEPNGLETLRIEKANYLKALAALQQSKTQLVAAQAAAEQALAAQRTAEATYQTALANYQDALTAALRAQTEMDQQRFAIEMQNLTALYEHEALMRALDYDAAVAALDAMKEKYAAEAAEAAVKLAMLQAEVDYKALLNEAQRIQNLKDQQDMELAKKAFEQEYGQQAAMFALQLARYEAETAQKAAEAAALVAAQELLNKNQELQNSQLAQEIEQAQKAFEQQYGYQEALNALELARIEAANNAAAAEAQAKLEDLIDQFGYDAAMRALAIARQAVQDENDAAAMEIALKELEQAYNKQVALDAVEIAKAQIDLAKANLDLEGFAAGIENLKKQFEYAEIYRAYELQKAIDQYGIDALTAANQIENLKMKQQYNKVLFAQAIAEAKQSLKETLDSIDLKNVGLTDDEWKRVNEVIRKYEKAYAKYLDQQLVVMDAESDLFDAQYAATHPSEDYYVYLTKAESAQHAGLYTLNFAPTAENYEAAIDLLRDFIEADKQAIAELEEKGSLPNDADLRAWADQLQAWKDQMGKNEYYQYAQTQDSINYMVNVFHDGIAEVAKEVLDWCMEHPYIAAPDPVAEVMEPDLSKIDAMTIADMPAADLEFDSLPIAYGNPALIDRFSDFSTNKLYYMFHYGNSWGNVFAFDYDDEGKVVITVNGNRNMKELILGGYDYDTNKVIEAEGYTNYYGLKGVYSALDRDKVMMEKDDSFKTKAKANYDNAKKRWEDDYAILKNKTIGKYQPYVDAAAAFKEAKDALDAAKKAAKEKGDTMVNALWAFVGELNKVGDHAQMTYNDSVALVKAVVDFAAARKAYFPASAAAKAKYDVYHYAAASDPVTEGTIAWEDITFASIRPLETRTAGTATKALGFEYTTGDPYWSTQRGYAWTYNGIFAMLTEQLINDNFAQKFDAEPVKKQTETQSAIETVFNSREYKAFYGEFKYVPEAGTVPEHFETLAGDPIVDPAVAAAEAAYEKALENLLKAIIAYQDIYNRFWAENATISTAASTKINAYVEKPTDANLKAMTTEIDKCFPLDCNCYTDKTFMEPFVNVTFYGMNINAIDYVAWAEDLDVVLTAVDPNVTDRIGVHDFADGYPDAAILFGTYARDLKKGSKVTSTTPYLWDLDASHSSKATEFTQYMFALWVYELSQHGLAQDLELLKAWIESIEETIAADEAAAEEELEAFKEELKEKIMTGYEEALAKHDAAVEAYNAQMEARNQMLDDWAEFFGVYDNPLTGEPDTLAYYWILDRDCAHWSVDHWRNSFSCVNYHNQYIDQEAGVWNGPQPGMMRNLIAGKFQEILDTNLPGYPEKVAQWNHFHRQYVDVQYHLQTIYDTMNSAYMAAAKVVDPSTTETDLIKYVEDYKLSIENAIADLYDEINEHTALIEILNYAKAQVEAGYDPIAVWQKACENNLELQNQILDDLKTKLDLRKADYDAVMEYINAKSEE